MPWDRGRLIALEWGRAETRAVDSRYSAPPTPLQHTSGTGLTFALCYRDLHPLLGTGRTNSAWPC